ncbi:MAG TPA: LuxR C-terminal-related transcriptional regulator, partial [Capillimicrobium sp.]|nr:LuxR C-terminal-related transcriptional regulator [Capillimicrobium sp.]
LAAEAAAAGDRALSARLLLEASLGHMFEGDMEALVEVATRARERAEGVADDLAALAALVTGEALLALGRSEEGDALVAAAEPLLYTADPLSEISEVVGMGAMTSLWVERFERVERIVQRMVSVTRAAGAVARLTYPLAVRSQLHWRRGRWAAAYADAEESVELARGTGQVGTLALSLAMLARSEGGIGRLDAARAHGQEGVELSEVAAGDATVMHSLAALGFVELSAGRAEEAAAWLDRADATDRRLGHGEPALTMFAADHVEALVRAGRREDAARALERLAAGARRTGGAWSNAVAERARALLAEDVDAAVAHATAALRWHDRVAMPFERARTELVLGERLRRARRRADARAPLESALAVFERIGAEPWARRARTELQAIGGRTRAHVAGPVEQLTPHELQVALLVADGLTNREVAAALFLSPKTIEHHLSAIYRKLDLRSRAQLSALLAADLAAEA